MSETSVPVTTAETPSDAAAPSTSLSAQLQVVLDKIETIVKDVDKAKEILAKAVADGLEDEAGAATLNPTDWAGYGVPKIKATQLYIVFLPLPPAPAPVAAAAPVAPPVQVNVVSPLPQVPDDETFLRLLQVGGALKPQPADVMSAVRVLFASRYGIFKVEDGLIELMEQRVKETDEAFPPVYYDIQRQLARKAHGAVLQALDIPGKIFSDRAKRDFLGRLGEIWSVLESFQGKLSGWQKTWESKMTNPGMLVPMIGAAMGGVGVGGLSGMMNAPDTSPVIDSASSVIDAINRMFSGAGSPVARALAADAIQLRDILAKSELLSATGAASNEELLRKLGLGVSSDAVRTERAVTQYVLAVMKLPETPVNQLPNYISSLYELGVNIPWATLNAASSKNGGNGHGRGTLRDGSPSDEPYPVGGPRRG